MLELLTIPLLAAHLLAMNLASSGPLLAAWLHFRGDEFSLAIGRRLLGWSISSFLIGMITGGLLILTIPGGSLWAALERFPARTYWFAGGELVFSLACIELMAYGWQRFKKWLIAMLALITATNLLYHFPPLMAVIGKLTANATFTPAALVDRPTLLGLIRQDEVMALSFHFGCSAFAVSAIALIHLIARDASQVTGERGAIASRAAGIAFVTTLLQIPIGVWLLLSLPGTSRVALMGNSLGGSLAFMAAMVLSLILLQRLFAALLGDMERKNLRMIVALTCLVVLLMTMSLRLSRVTRQMPAVVTKTASSANARG